MNTENSGIKTVVDKTIDKNQSEIIQNEEILSKTFQFIKYIFISLIIITSTSTLYLINQYHGSNDFYPLGIYFILLLHLIISTILIPLSFFKKPITRNLIFKINYTSIFYVLIILSIQSNLRGLIEIMYILSGSTETQLFTYMFILSTTIYLIITSLILKFKKIKFIYLTIIIIITSSIFVTVAGAQLNTFQEKYGCNGVQSCSYMYPIITDNIKACHDNFRCERGYKQSKISDYDSCRIYYSHHECINNNPPKQINLDCNKYSGIEYKTYCNNHNLLISNNDFCITNKCLTNAKYNYNRTLEIINYLETPISNELSKYIAKNKAQTYLEIKSIKESDLYYQKELFNPLNQTQITAKIYIYKLNQTNSNDDDNNDNNNNKFGTVIISNDKHYNPKLFVNKSQLIKQEILENNKIFYLDNQNIFTQNKEDNNSFQNIFTKETIITEKIKQIIKKRDNSNLASWKIYESKLEK
jgi:hypothetical protein